MTDVNKVAHFDRQNLDLARRIVSKPEAYRSDLQLWARATIGRLGSAKERQALADGGEHALREAIASREEESRGSG